MNEDIVVPIAGMITGIVIVIGVPLAIVYARRRRGSAAAR